MLLLGSSETPGELADEFETLDEHCKVYRKRRDIRLPAEMRLPLSSGPSRLRTSGAAVPGLAAARTASQESSMLPLYDRLLDKFMPPSLLVNSKRELVESFAGAERLLRIGRRRLSRDLLDLLDTDSKTSIAGASTGWLSSASR